MPEISDAELSELKQTKALLSQLYADSARGMEFRKLIKAKWPQASIPELDAIVKTEELGGSIEKKFGELSKTVEDKLGKFFDDRKKEKEDGEVEAFKTRLDRIVKERGYTKEGEEKLLTLMKDRGIHNIEDAAIIFESNQPKVKGKPRQFSSRMQFITPDNKDDESFKQLMENPDQWMMDQMTNDLAAAAEEE